MAGVSSDADKRQTRLMLARAPGDFVLSKFHATIEYDAVGDDNCIFITVTGVPVKSNLNPARG